MWACTACGACIEVCPVGNEPMFDILYMRRDQVLMESSFPEQLQAAFTGMERTRQSLEDERRRPHELGRGPGRPHRRENPDFDVLWWVGCAPAYDMRAQATAKAFAKVLQGRRRELRRAGRARKLHRRCGPARRATNISSSRWRPAISRR